MDLQEEREAFESTLKQIGRVDDSNFTVADDGSYEWDSIHFAWTIWQAAKAQAVPEWISVEDELPPTDTMVLICWSDSPDIEPEKDFMDICTDTGCPFWANYLNDMPTHWMHLPVVAQEPAND